MAHAETASAVASVGEVSLKITRGDDRPWGEKWLTILHCLDALRETYSGDARTLGNVEIGDTDVTPNGARVTIEVNWATPQATKVDALDLAEDCVKSWRAFFVRFAIAEP